MKMIKNLVHRLNNVNFAKQAKIYLYLINGRKPWSIGYSLFKENIIRKSINDSLTIDIFQNSLQLPKQYGEFLDERVVEYPWLISRISQGEGKLLDAGSVLNFAYLLENQKLKNKDITIMTLEPEGNCYWWKKISYLFGDLRKIPIKDDWFDEVVSSSTIEHIGMDNSIYSSNPTFRENKCLDYLQAVSEFKRVTKPGGKVYITVPYGQYTDFGWYQQFNAEMIDLLIDTFAPAKLIETYFCYESGGWSISDKQYCQKFQGFNIHETKYFNPNSTKDYDSDYAACSRAIAALELWK
jgi:SAM-dependent methyltransferase